MPESSAPNQNIPPVIPPSERRRRARAAGGAIELTPETAVPPVREQKRAPEAEVSPEELEAQMGDYEDTADLKVGAFQAASGELKSRLQKSGAEVAPEEATVGINAIAATDTKAKQTGAALHERYASLRAGEEEAPPVREKPGQYFGDVWVKKYEAVKFKLKEEIQVEIDKLLSQLEQTRDVLRQPTGAEERRDAEEDLQKIEFYLRYFDFAVELYHQEHLQDSLPSYSWAQMRQELKDGEEHPRWRLHALKEHYAEWAMEWEALADQPEAQRSFPTIQQRLAEYVPAPKLQEGYKFLTAPKARLSLSPDQSSAMDRAANQILNRCFKEAAATLRSTLETAPAEYHDQIDALIQELREEEEKESFRYERMAELQEEAYDTVLPLLPEERRAEFEARRLTEQVLREGTLVGTLEPFVGEVIIEGRKYAVGSGATKPMFGTFSLEIDGRQETRRAVVKAEFSERVSRSGTTLGSGPLRSGAGVIENLTMKLTDIPAFAARRNLQDETGREFGAVGISEFKTGAKSLAHSDLRDHWYRNDDPAWQKILAAHAAKDFVFGRQDGSPRNYMVDEATGRLFEIDKDNDNPPRPHELISSVLLRLKSGDQIPPEVKELLAGQEALLDTYREAAKLLPEDMTAALQAMDKRRAHLLQAEEFPRYGDSQWFDTSWSVDHYSPGLDSVTKPKEFKGPGASVVTLEMVSGLQHQA